MQFVGVMESVENDQSHVKFLELMGCVWWLDEFIAAHGGMNLLAIIQILTQIPKSFIPFRMWHITGFTSELSNLTIP